MKRVVILRVTLTDEKEECLIETEEAIESAVAVGLQELCDSVEVKIMERLTTWANSPLGKESSDL